LIAEKRREERIFQFLDRTYVYSYDESGTEVLFGLGSGNFTMTVLSSTSLADAVFFLLAHNNVFQLHESFVLNRTVKPSGLPVYSTPLAYYQSALVDDILRRVAPPYSSLFIREFLVLALKRVVEGYRKVSNAGHEEELSVCAQPKCRYADQVSLLLGLVGGDIIGADDAVELIARSAEKYDTKPIMSFILRNNLLEKADPVYTYFYSLGKYSPFFDRVKERVSIEDLDSQGQVPQLLFEVSFRAFDRPEDLAKILSQSWSVPVTVRKKRGGGYRVTIGKGRNSSVFYLSEQSMYEAGKAVRLMGRKLAVTFRDVLTPSRIVFWTVSKLAREIYERLDPVPPTVPARPGVYVKPGRRTLTVLAMVNRNIVIEQLASVRRLVELVEKPVLVSPVRVEDIIGGLGEDFYGDTLTFTLAKKTGIVSLADAQLLGRIDGRTYYSVRVARRRWALIEENNGFVSVVDVASDPSVFKNAYETVKTETENKWADVEQVVERAGGQIIQKGTTRFALKNEPGEINATVYDVESSGWTVSIFAFESDIKLEKLAENIRPDDRNCKFTSRLAQHLRSDGWDARMVGCVLIAGRGRRRLIAVP